MPSKKVTMILRSNTDLAPDAIAELSEADAWDLVYAARPKKKVDDRPQICFTGFGTSKKKKLSALASDANLSVVKSVTVGLTYLCGDDNAGPRKIEKARAQGASFISELDFLRMVDR